MLQLTPCPWVRVATLATLPTVVPAASSSLWPDSVV